MMNQPPSHRDPAGGAQQRAGAPAPDREQQEAKDGWPLGASDYAEAGVRAVRRFARHDMSIYAAALAHRGLLALVPSALLLLVLMGLFSLEHALPRLTELLLRLRPGAAGATDVPPLSALLSASAVVGAWSAATGARMLMRALNAAHEIEERRPPVTRVALSFCALPALAVVMMLATGLLLATSQGVAWLAGGIGLGVVIGFLESWLRVPAAFVLVGGAVSAVYRYGPGARPPWWAVATGAALAVLLWAAASLAFGLAVSTVLDYGGYFRDRRCWRIRRPRLGSGVENSSPAALHPPRFCYVPSPAD